MSRHRYYTRPRPVEAAQWSPDLPGDVISLLINHGIDWETYPGGLLCIDPKSDGIRVEDTNWIVIDDAGVEVFPDTRFRELFEYRTMRSGGGVTNTITGPTTGTVVQVGDHWGNLRL